MVNLPGAFEGGEKMLNIIIYTLCGIGIGFSLGMMAAAVLLDRCRARLEGKK